jgi:hypothetical protein
LRSRPYYPGKDIPYKDILSRGGGAADTPPVADVPNVGTKPEEDESEGKERAEY